MAEGARLESVYTATYRGFESPPHRHILRRARTKVRAFFSHVAHLRGDEKPRPGFDYWRSQLDRPGAQRTGFPAGASKASQSPPHRHILRRARTQVRAFFSHVAHLRGMRSPDRSCTGVKQQSPVSRALKTEYISVVSVERPLTKRRADAIVFIETNNPNHLIFFETGQRIAKP